MNKEEKNETNYQLLNKIVLFTIDTYIDRIKADKIQMPKVFNDLKYSIITYKRSNKFTQEEGKEVLEFAQTQEMKDIIEIEISHIIFLLTIIKIWVSTVPKKERPILNISDRRLVKGKAEFAMAMLKMKQSDKENYEVKKEIMNTSVFTAEKFMDYHFKVLTKTNTIKMKEIT